MSLMEGESGVVLEADLGERPIETANAIEAFVSRRGMGRRSRRMPRLPRVGWPAARAAGEKEKPRTMRTVLLTAAALLLAGPAGAAETDDYLLETAGDLAALCGAPTDVSAIHMCHGFLVGVHRVLASVGHGLGEPLYCLPTDGSASRDTVARDFAAWVAATPDAAAMPPSDGLLHWVRATYPCR
jgi:hypothetical protein